MSFLKKGGGSLVERAAGGDAAAVKSIYDAHVRYLTAVCLRYVPSSDDAKDVLQDAFVRIFSSLGGFRGDERVLRAWMRRIVVNEALMYLRRNNRNILVYQDGPLPDRGQDEDPEPEGIPPDVLQKMISDLPDGYRTIFNLYVFEDMSHKEIARLLGIRENTSTSQYHRAKALLAKKIKEYADEQRLEK